MYVTLVRCDDWTALYRNGRLYDQNHSLDLRAVLEAIAGQGSIHFDHFWVKDDWAHDQGHFPANLGEIPQEARL